MIAYMSNEIELLDEREAAQRLGLSVATMRRRRLLRLPPVWVKLGGRVLYQTSSLAEFVEANVVKLPEPRGRR
jgi:predicted DNA-binding transcriptional regulator AlpA